MTGRLAGAVARLRGRRSAPGASPGADASRPVRIRFATINAPERTDRSKRNLIAPIKRAHAVIRFLNREGVSIAMLQESGSVMRAAIRLHPRWRLEHARPNTIIRGHELGNTAAIRRRHWPKVRDRERIVTPRTGRGRDLNHIARLLQHRTGALLAVVGAHRQTRGSDPRGESRKAARNAIGDFTKDCVDRGLSVAAGVDWNGQEPNYAHLKLAASHGVDHILVSRDIKVGGHDSHRLHRVSDHHAVTADLELPAPAGRPDIARLPKPPTR